MSNQLIITSGAKVRNLNGVLTGTAGVVDSVPLGGANGVATLDSSGKVPVSQLPASVVTYLGTWNAATNTPTLTNGVGDAGDMYLCNVAGTVDFGAGPISFNIGDWVLYGSGTWQKSNGQNGTVTSVDMTVPTGLAISGNPITTSGTLALSLASGYTIPTTSFLSGLVPYTGATGNVDLGTYGIKADYSQFNLTPSSVPTTVGTLSWDSEYRTLQLIDGDGDTTLQIGQEQRALIHNGTGSTLTDGQVVYVTGSTGQLPSVALASNALESTSSVTFGVVTETIPNGEDGFVTISGMVNGLNTLAFNEGDAIYLGATAGTFTNVKPTAPANLVLIGYVIKKAGGNGSIFVKIQNGYELEELHDVLITSVANNEGIFWDSATSLWKNKSIPTALGYTPVPTTRSLTINGAAYDLSADRSWSVGTVTSVDLSVPTGFSISGNPITSSGTLALGFASGYSLPTNVKQSNWDDAYTWVANFPTQTGNAGKFLTTDGSTLSWASNPLGTVTSVGMSVPTGLTVTGSPITSSGTLAVTFTAGYSIPTTASQSNWDTAYTNRITSLTTTGSSGAATLTSNTLNIPNYTLAGLGGQPLSTNLTSLSGLSYASTSFVKMTAAGTFSLDTNTYATASSLSGYVPYTGATTNVDLGSRNLSASQIYVPPVSTLASGATIRTYNPTDANWGFSNTTGAGAGLNQYHIRVHGSSFGDGNLRQFQVVNTSDNNSVNFAVNFDGTGALFKTGLGLGGSIPTNDRQFSISGTSFTTGTSQYQAVINTTFANAATNLYGLYVHNNTNVNVTASYSLYIPATGGTGTVTNKWGIYQGGSGDNNYFAGKLLVNTTTDAGGYQLQSNGSILSTGSGGGFVFADRSTNSNLYTWYATGGSAYIYYSGSASNILQIASTGAATFSSSVTAGGNINITTGGGALVFTNTSSSNKRWDISSSGNDFTFNETGISERMRITSGGNVLMNTTTTPGTGGFTDTTLLVKQKANGVAGGGIQIESNTDDSLLFMGFDGSAFRIGTSYRTGGSYQPILFSTGGSERMRITNGGNVLIGTTTDGGYKLDVNGTGVFRSNLQVNGNVNANAAYLTGTNYDFPNAVVMANDTNWTYGIAHPGSEYWMQVKYYGTGDDSRGFRVFNVNGNTVDFRVNGGGSGFFRNTVTATGFFESSDKRIKKEITDNPTIKGIESIKPKLYVKAEKEELGYYAQDLQEVLPSAVTEGSDGFLNLSYTQVHTAKIAQLEAEVAELKELIKKLL